MCVCPRLTLSTPLKTDARVGRPDLCCSQELKEGKTFRRPCHQLQHRRQQNLVPQLPGNVLCSSLLLSHGLKQDRLQIVEGQDSTEAELAAATAAANSGKPVGSKAQNQSISMNEIGPRFVLSPIKIFEGSFSGATLYENEQFISPQAAMVDRNVAKANKYRGRKMQDDAREEKLERLEANAEDDPLETRKVFA